MVDEQKPSVSEFKLAGGAKKRVALNIHGDGDGEAAGDAAKGAGPKVRLLRPTFWYSHTRNRPSSRC